MSFASRKIVQATLRRSQHRAAVALQQRLHHPDPFNPKMTRGWKAALKVRNDPNVSLCLRMLWHR
jgi:hypothetical protein